MAPIQYLLFLRHTQEDSMFAFCDVTGITFFSLRLGSSEISFLECSFFIYLCNVLALAFPGDNDYIYPHAQVKMECATCPFR